MHPKLNENAVVTVVVVAVAVAVAAVAVCVGFVCLFVCWLACQLSCRFLMAVAFLCCGHSRCLRLVLAIWSSCSMASVEVSLDASST